MTSRTILVVEDERPVRDLLVTVLTRQGFLVCTASTAEDALEMERQQHIDLLLTDVMLPRMSGPQLARAIRERSPGIKVLFMSGYAGALLKEEDMAGAEFLQKPFDARVVADKIKALLDPTAD